MKLSTKGRYGVTAMMDLAIHDNAGPVTLADISQCQGISLSYLEQLFSKLRKANLVEGVRGPGGGYRLSRPAEEINIAEIISADVYLWSVHVSAVRPYRVCCTSHLNRSKIIAKNRWLLLRAGYNIITEICYGIR